MKTGTYRWNAGGSSYEFELAAVAGTHGEPFEFGVDVPGRRVNVNDFAIGRTTVTEAFWAHIMGDDPRHAKRPSPRYPVDDVSWDELTGPVGFLERFNASAVHAQLAHPDERFRLPTETEWEYAARGGPHWRDGYRFSGSDDADLVAWHDRRNGDHPHPAALKLPNQLGLYDMSGNMWEWCQDAYTPDVTLILPDGSAYTGRSDERVLRGGCFHNWAIHCTVSKRYSIAPDFHDGCISVRVVLA